MSCFYLFSVMVSLVRIRGTDCKATELGQVADLTGGQVCKTYKYYVVVLLSSYTVFLLASSAWITNFMTFKMKKQSKAFLLMGTVCAYISTNKQFYIQFLFLMCTCVLIYSVLSTYVLCITQSLFVYSGYNSRSIEYHKGIHQYSGQPYYCH